MDCCEEEDGMMMQGVSAPPLVSVKNHLYLYSEIDSLVTRTLFNVLHEMAMGIIHNSIENNCELTPIYLHICSRGGDVSYAFGIIKLIKDIQNGTIHCFGEHKFKVPIISVIDAEADSCASLIACVCSKRLISKNAFSLIHPPRQNSGNTFEKTEDIDDKKYNLEVFKDRIYEIYLEHSKLNRKKLEQICSNEKYSTPEELVSYGLVDEIID